MKKFILTFLAVMTMAFMMLAMPASANAAQVKDFKVTNGINPNKSNEITFDYFRVVSGTSEPGSQVSITIYEPIVANSTTTYKYVRGYNLIVGSSGIFSQNIALKEGKNYIVVAAKNLNDYSDVKANKKKKKAVLKATLSQSIAMPGSSNW